MPRKLRNPKVRTALTLGCLTISEILAFTAAWSPPVTEDDRRLFPRWPDWEAYFRDYDLLRDELLASEFHQPAEPLFADEARRALASAQPGEVWEKHRHCALQHSHLYQRDDAHTHDGWEKCLGPAVEVGATQARQDGPPGGS